jgi:taurine transport system permease protein
MTFLTGRTSREGGSVEKFISVAVVILIMIMWWMMAKSGAFTPIILPSPGNVLKSFIKIWNEGYRGISLYRHLANSLWRLFASFVLVMVTAIPLGIVSGFNSKICAVFDPIVEFYRPLPPLGYYTLLVLWMGIDNSSKIALLYLAGFAPIFIACVAAVKKIRGDYIEGAYTLGANRRQVLMHVVFPACLPDIFTGLRTSIGVSYTTLVAAEMVAAVSGIGWMVLDASKFLRSDIVFAGIIIMGFSGILIDRVLRVIEERIVPWKGKMG